MGTSRLHLDNHPLRALIQFTERIVLKYPNFEWLVLQDPMVSDPCGVSANNAAPSR